MDSLVLQGCQRASSFGGLHAVLCGQDRYQLLNMIGRGGFSEIYKAFDLEQSLGVAGRVASPWLVVIGSALL